MYKQGARCHDNSEGILHLPSARPSYGHIPCYYLPKTHEEVLFSPILETTSPGDFITWLFTPTPPPPAPPLSSAAATSPGLSCSDKEVGASLN